MALLSFTQNVGVHVGGNAKGDRESSYKIIYLLVISKFRYSPLQAISQSCSVKKLFSFPKQPPYRNSSHDFVTEL